MWRKFKYNVFNVYKNAVKVFTKDETQEECKQQFETSLTVAINDMQMQFNGKWVSKCILEAILETKNDQKLLKVCQQRGLLKLEDVFTKEICKRMQVLWSGCYSEVLRVTALEEEEDSVFKISYLYQMNRLGNVIERTGCLASDVIISKLLSDLKSIPLESAVNYCENFANITNSYFVWSNRMAFNAKDLKQTKSKNTQKYEYFISQQTFGGNELDSVFGLSPSKGLNIALQLIASLAVAEEAIQFEHRDLHCSNILIKETQQKYADYVINGQRFAIKLNGIKIVIIDTTFSRSQLKIAVDDNEEVVKCFYNNLSSLDLDYYPNSELKKVYLKQKQITSNQWQKFWPKTNIIWLCYCLNKIVRKVDKWCRKRSIDPKSSLKRHLDQLKRIQQLIGDYDSAKDFAKVCQMIEI